MINNLPSTIKELLLYSDEEFVRYAYLCLLNREPDKKGADYYLARLYQGIKKVNVLIEIRFSKEGKLRNINTSGINQLVWRNRWQKSFAFKLFRKFKKESLYAKLRKIEIKLDLIYKKILANEQIASSDIFCNKKNIEIIKKNYEELQLLSPHARDIYFQLKSAAKYYKKNQACE